MEAKLVKEYGDFYLVSDKEIQKGDEYVKLDNRPRMLLLGTTIASAKVSKLSLKNCQAIENGYDLDELAKHCSKQEYYDWGGEVFEQDYLDTRYTAYKQGFQKCLELMGDKKFSDVNMEDAYYFGSKKCREEYLDFIKTFQQTEWDVEVEMVCPHPVDTYRCGIQYGCDEDGCNHPNQVPYLDADGCLILKRK